MFLAILAWTWVRSLVAALLNALTAVPSGALLTTPHIDLYTNSHTPSPTDTYSTYTLPTFTGYASASLTLTGPVNTGPTTQSKIGTVVFELTGTTGGSAVCYGCILSDGVSTLYGAYLFPTPMNFVNVGDFLSLSIALPIAEILPNNV